VLTAQERIVTASWRFRVCRKVAESATPYVCARRRSAASITPEPCVAPLT